MNKKILSFSILSIVVIAAIFFMVFHQHNKIHHKKTVHKTTHVTEKQTTVPSSPLEEKTVTSFMTQHNQGLPKEIDSFQKNVYFVINQLGIHTYDKEFTGDKLDWVYQKKGKTTYHSLTDGTYLVKVIKDGNSPFIHVEGKTFLVFYERQNFEKNGINMKGYIYAIEKNGTLKKVYETQDSFADFQFKPDSMMIGEKIYNDPINEYPTMYKPYTLQYSEYKNGEWKVVKTEQVAGKFK